MKKIGIPFLLCLFLTTGFTQSKTENVIVITLDGFRWQELFSGADDSLINNPKFSFDTAGLKKNFGQLLPMKEEKNYSHFSGARWQPRGSCMVIVT
jgi:hypothetical protein